MESHGPINDMFQIVDDPILDRWIKTTIRNSELEIGELEHKVNRLCDALDVVVWSMYKSGEDTADLELLLEECRLPETRERWDELR